MKLEVQMLLLFAFSDKIFDDPFVSQKLESQFEDMQSTWPVILHSPSSELST